MVVKNEPSKKSLNRSFWVGFVVFLVVFCASVAIFIAYIPPSFIMAYLSGRSVVAEVVSREARGEHVTMDVVFHNLSGNSVTIFGPEILCSACGDSTNFPVIVKPHSSRRMSVDFQRKGPEGNVIQIPFLSDVPDQKRIYAKIGG